MIKIPYTNIEDKVRSSDEVATGLDLIDIWQSNLIIPNGIVPFIAGGAVRDTMFRNDVPHDIDIFFLKGDGYQSNPNTGQHLHNNLLLWLEDQEIQWTSLSREQIEQYQNPNSYIDIIEFEFSGVRIQVMIPNNIRGMDAVAENFPVMCRAFLNRTGLYFSLATWAALQYDRPVAVSQRDFNYARKKWPGLDMYAWTNATEMYSCIINTKWATRGLATVTIPSNAPGRNIPFSVTPAHPNSLGVRFRTLVREEFNLPQDFALDNSVHQGLGGNWTEGRAGRQSAASPSTGQFSARFTTDRPRSMF